MCNKQAWRAFGSTSTLPEYMPMFNADRESFPTGLDIMVSMQIHS